MLTSDHGAATAVRHPLAEMILDAAAGRFPTADGSWHRLPPWRTGLQAIVAFTGHAVFCVEDDVEQALLEQLGIDGLGGATSPRVLSVLTGPEGWTSCLDLVMVRQPSETERSGRALVERRDLFGEPRVAYAARLRDDLTVYGYPEAGRSAVAIVGRGIAGLPELSYEIEQDRRSRGEGGAFVRAALRAIDADALRAAAPSRWTRPASGQPGSAPVVACVAPGNAASLRVLLACNFVPVGSVQLFRRQPGYVPSLSG